MTWYFCAGDVSIGFACLKTRSVLVAMRAAQSHGHSAATAEHAA
jgi:hypothetical protein